MLALASVRPDCRWTVLLREGFLPRKAGERARRLQRLAAEERTLVFFEAPHRTAGRRGAMARRGAATRGGGLPRSHQDHEEVRPGGSPSSPPGPGRAAGEVTIVVAG